MEWNFPRWDVCLVSTGFLSGSTTLPLQLNVMIVGWECLHRWRHDGDSGDRNASIDMNINVTVTSSVALI